jgi:hypothetical protein
VEQGSHGASPDELKERSVPEWRYLSIDGFDKKAEYLACSYRLSR